jgi:AP-1 complex subunit gamma-1
VAVQKYMTLKLQQISKPTLGPNAQRDATQEMTIVNTLEGQKPLALKIRVTYSVNGQNVDQTKVLNSLPTHY